MRTSIVFEYCVGEAGLKHGARVQFGVPNTGWEEPVPPQQRYWDELVQGADRRLAPFHRRDELRRIEVVSPSGTARVVSCAQASDKFEETIQLPAIRGGFYYLRIMQSDGERAWTSPVFFE